MYKKFYAAVVLNFFVGFCLYAAPAPPCNINASITASNNTICAGDVVTLTANGNNLNNYTYLWSTGETTRVITATPGSNTTYSVTITDTTNAGCNDNANRNITVNSVPVVSIAPASVTPICAHTPVTLTGSAPGGGNFHWSNNSNNTSITVSPVTTTTYTLSVTRNGCTGTQSRVVQVTSADMAGIFVNCNAVTIAPYTITLSDASNPSTGNTQYTIVWGDTGVNYNSAAAPSGLQHTYGGGTFTLTYIVHMASGCIDTNYLTVRNLTNPSLAVGSPGNTLGCGPLPLCFPILNVSNNDPSTNYVVDYGDGSAQETYSQPPPDTLCHTYTR